MTKFDGVRGTLLQCCLETLAETLYPDGPAKVATEGQELRCKVHPLNPRHVMAFRDGAWEWKQQEEET